MKNNFFFFLKKITKFFFFFLLKIIRERGNKNIKENMKKIIPLSKKMKIKYIINAFIELIFVVLSILGIHYLQPGSNRIIAAYKLGLDSVESIDTAFWTCIIVLIIMFAVIAVRIYKNIFKLNIFGIFGENQYDSKIVYVRSNKYKYTDIQSISQKTFINKNTDIIVLVLLNGKKIEFTCPKNSIQKYISEMSEYLIQSKNINIS
ncbi:hypothetical protein MCSF7_00351 [Mycoplasmopsis columbina SF7]|uniref:Uncharacterized protein n=2 Tax=Mycoplasmopsis columbina TaxID=114881 RepID=F9UJM4_9BACT|nr:hypothetical protein MCSF7_00351 [Mycoplasmopsis columbina SF7]